MGTQGRSDWIIGHGPSGRSSIINEQTSAAVTNNRHELLTSSGSPRFVANVQVTKPLEYNAEKEENVTLGEEKKVNLNGEEFHLHTCPIACNTTT